MSAPVNIAPLKIAIPGEKQSVQVEVELVPAEAMPETLKKSTHVTRVNVGGKEFFAVVGKTTTV